MPHLLTLLEDFFTLKTKDGELTEEEKEHLKHVTTELDRLYKETTP